MNRMSTHRRTQAVDARTPRALLSAPRSVTTPDQGETKRSLLRKLTPNCPLPTGGALKALSVEQVQRLRRVLSEPLEVVLDPVLRSAGAEGHFRAAEPLVSRLLSAGSQIPHHEGATPPRIKALTLAEERVLFLAYNYARLRLMRLLQRHAGKRMTASSAAEIVDWDRAASRVCDAIVQANLGLVPTMVERSRVTGVDFAELISEGHLALLRSISKFDCSRGFKFSTYACRAILTSIIRSVALMARHRAHVPTEFDPDLQKVDLVEARRSNEQDEDVGTLRNVLRSNRADLTRAERKVLFERFGIDVGRTRRSGPQKTLREVAAVFGVTKERVRQIQNKALDKLRGVLDPEGF